MSGPREKHIALVRKLHALARSTRFEGERENALARAKAIMERYSLTEADITGRLEHPVCPGCGQRHPPGVRVRGMRPTVTFTDDVIITKMMLIMSDNSNSRPHTKVSYSGGTVRFYVWYEEI